MVNLKKTTKSGPNIIEVEHVQSKDRGAETKERKKRCGTTNEGQQKANFFRRVRELCRIVNENFTTQGDLFIRLSFIKDQPNRAEAFEAFKVFIGKVKAYRRLMGLAEVKYIVVPEYRRKRMHLHVIMSNMDMNAVGRLWPFGGCSMERLYTDDFQGLAFYLNKEKPGKGEHAWIGSKNLIKPKSLIDQKPLSRVEMDRPIQCPIGFREVYQTKTEIEQDGYQGTYKYAKFVRIGTFDIAMGYQELNEDANMEYDND